MAWRLAVLDGRATLRPNSGMLEFGPRPTLGELQRTTPWVWLATGYGNSLSMRVTREPVGNEDKGGGYEYSKNSYVLVDDDELDAVAVESTHTIEIDSFVPRQQRPVRSRRSARQHEVGRQLRWDRLH
ncbi:MAG: Ku protein, partial [Xanthobacteraceae bacterium]